MKTGFELKSLSVKYPFQKALALDDISLEIPLGSFTVVLGANGSGKSTLLKCLAGVQQWSAGTLYLDGQSRGIDCANFNAHQILISEDIVVPDLTIERLRITYQKIWKNFDEETFKRIIGYSAISMDKLPKELSRGQRILIQFALGLATKVPIVLVDEVTAALDPYVRRKVIEELKTHSQGAGTVVLATNIASETQHINSRLVLINSGRIFKMGNHHDIRKDFVKKYFENEQADQADSRWVEVSRDDHGIFAVTERSELHEGHIADVVSLEEIFTYFVEKANR